MPASAMEHNEFSDWERVIVAVDNDISITKCSYDYDGAIKAGSDHALIEADIQT